MFHPEEVRASRIFEPQPMRVKKKEAAERKVARERMAKNVSSKRNESKRSEAESIYWKGIAPRRQNKCVRMQSYI